jgi:hypothetical protein
MIFQRLLAAVRAVSGDGKEGSLPLRASILRIPGITLNQSLKSFKWKQISMKEDGFGQDQ